MASRNSRKYKRIFLKANGSGPWFCYYSDCDDLVQLSELHVHHIDEDHQNNDPANLTAVHGPCHTKLHHTGRKQSDDERRHHSEALRGIKRSEETRRKISAAQLGKPNRLPKHRCGDCPMITNAGNLARHHRRSGHSGRIDV